MADNLWALPRPADLVWREWDDLGAVHDAGSGSTHVLNVLAIELLAMLASGPASTQALVEGLRADMPADLEPAVLASMVEAQLSTLQALQLIHALAQSDA